MPTLDPPADFETRLEAIGAASLGQLLDADACAALRATYDAPKPFRKTIDMARHGFGAGQYQYFADPLPPVVDDLRERLYARLAPLANRHAERLGEPRRWPETMAEMRALCAGAGQTQPTPLLLRYGPGDFNRLHQDVYGAVAFPLQVVVQLSRPGEDFDGGAFVVVETRPRMQSRATVFTPILGEAIVFHTRECARRSARGWSRAPLRHGVSEVTRGARMTLGLIFHDAA